MSKKDPPKQITPNEEAVLESPSQDKTSRHETDAFLRSFVWRIYSRNRDREAMWKKGEKIVTQREALKICRRKQ